MKIEVDDISQYLRKQKPYSITIVEVIKKRKMTLAFLSSDF